MSAPPLPPVQLRPEEIAAVRVFGSRARLDMRGGDLHVRVPSGTPPFGVEVGVADVLEKAMDDRHVDLVLLGTEDPPRRIDEVALATGVLL